MGEKILNMGCVFKCSCCPTVRLIPNEIMIHRVNVEGMKVLTTSTQMKVITAGACPFSEIPPNQTGISCIPRPIQGHWEKMSKHTIGGKNLLIESSEFICETSRLKGGDGRITAEIIPVTKSSQEKYMPLVIAPIVLKKDNCGNGKTSVTSKKVRNTHEKKIDNLHHNKEYKEDSVIRNNEDVAIEDLYCPYDSAKERCKKCEYVKANSDHMLSAKREGSSKQPGAILRENYERDFFLLTSTRKRYRSPCLSLQEEYHIFEIIGCGNQAHHILSTKDVYEQDKLKFVLKLANFYEYDVNEAYNCIVLPAYNSKAERTKNEFQVSFGKSSDFDKRVSKYYAMRKSGRQWHGGGHGDDFENSHNISCYATEVTDFVYQCMKRLKKDHCRIDTEFYEKDKKEFVTRLHRALDYVREKLIAFDLNPQNSLPFYVSRDAYEYAYNVANIRVLVFRRDDAKMRAYKYMFTRRAGETYPDERGVKSFDLNSELSKKMLVVFCEQIDIAYFDKSKGAIRLPFTINNIIEVDMRNMDVSQYFKTNISAIEAEIMDYNVSSDGNIMRKRLQEIKR